MNIGFVIGRYGGIDGVALETEKWADVLRNMGHEIYVLTGELEKDKSQVKDNVSILNELNFFHPLAQRDQKDSFFRDDAVESATLSHIQYGAEFIERHILAWIVHYKIDLLIPQNSLALPCHLSMGLAIANAIKKSKITTIAHHHDFSWERVERYDTKFESIKKLILENFPPDLSEIKHVVISTSAQEELKKRKNISSLVVPNVMDFNKPYAEIDTYNNDLRKSLGLAETDKLLFQITRIVARKGIHTAINLVEQLSDSEIKLIVTGDATDDHNKEYYCDLIDLIRDLNLWKQVLFKNDNFANFRKNENGKKTYSLQDGYAHAIACTYFSTNEGFGNAFLEAVVAKKPIFVNNYKPVFWKDIGSKGFDVVMIENSQLTKSAVNEISEIINNPEKQNKIAAKNYEIGKNFFSYEVLSDLLNQLLK